VDLAIGQGGCTRGCKFSAQFESSKLNRPGPTHIQTNLSAATASSLVIHLGDVQRRVLLKEWSGVESSRRSAVKVLHTLPPLPSCSEEPSLRNFVRHFPRDCPIGSARHNCGEEVDSKKGCTNPKVTYHICDTAGYVDASYG
jgi:hypothetical protein